jgi:hypothetical protein
MSALWWHNIPTKFHGCLNREIFLRSYQSLSLSTNVLRFYKSVFSDISGHRWPDNKVRELITVKVLHTSLLNITVVAFRVRPLESYAPMSALSSPFKTILELVLRNGLQSCRCITPDVNKMPFFRYFLIFGDRKSHWRLDPVIRAGVAAQLFAY